MLENKRFADDRAPPSRPIGAIRGELYFGVVSQLLFLAEFLETRIGPQRVPARIEPKKGRRKGAGFWRL